MHAASRHGTPSVTSLPKDGGVSCFGRSSIAHAVSDRKQPCLTSVKLMELPGPLGRSPHCWPTVGHSPKKWHFIPKSV